MKRHADIELGHSAYTDNDGIDRKVRLRVEAIKGLAVVNVLDLFAGDNLIWSRIPCQRYYGIEAEKNKGRNLHADNRKIIPHLDLSTFNVVDCDAYGMPYEQIQLLFDNPTLQSGTIIIYTCISGVLNRLCVRMLSDYNLAEQYKRSRVLYNRYSAEMFHAMLHSHGVKQVFCYRTKKSMSKEYGWFIVP